MVIIMPAGPLLYFYCRSTLDPEFTFSRKDWKHFYPIIIDLLPQIIAIIYLVGLAVGLLNNNPRPVFGFIDTYNLYADLPRWASLTIYLILAFRFTNSYKDNSQGEANLSLKWLRQLIKVFFVFQVIWLIYLIPYLMPSLNGKLLDIFNWYPIYVPLSVLIYWLGIKGYLMRQHQLAVTKAVKSIEFLPGAIDETVSALKKAMVSDKIYLNPELNLNLVSQYTGISPKIISTVLNQHLHESFNDFVNRYRIEAFKAKFSEQKNEHLTIVGIAFECGFNSQSTFQRAFKQFTGLSPLKFKHFGYQVK